MLPTVPSGQGITLPDVLLWAGIVCLTIATYFINLPTEAIREIEGTIEKCKHIPSYRSMGYTRTYIRLTNGELITAPYHKCKCANEVIVTHKKGFIFRNDVYEITRI